MQLPLHAFMNRLQDMDVFRNPRPFADLQGGILKPHGRAHTCLLFVELLEDNDAHEPPHRTLQRLLSCFPATSALHQHRDTLEHRSNPEHQTLFVSYAFSSAGFRRLGVPLDRSDRFFEHPPRFDDLDEDASPENAEPNPTAAAHLLIVLAHDLRDALDASIHDLGSLLAGRARILRRDGFWSAAHPPGSRPDRRANTEADAFEHFGFRDGIANPRFFANPDDPAGENDAGPGLVLLADWTAPVRAGIDPSGTYLVFLEFEQDTAVFSRTLASLATHVHGEDHQKARAEVAAQILGRTFDGQERNDDPFRSHTPPPGTSGAIAACPFASHVSAMKPRDPSERATRIVRRSCVFDDRTTTGRVGLHFLSYQKRMEYFLTLFPRWANQRVASDGGSRVSDALLGARSPGIPRFPLRDAAGQTTMVDLPRFVRLRASAVFFTPSIPGLRTIARLEQAESPTTQVGPPSDYDRTFHSVAPVSSIPIAPK